MIMRKIKTIKMMIFIKIIIIIIFYITVIIVVIFIIKIRTKIMNCWSRRILMSVYRNEKITK